MVFGALAGFLIFQDMGIWVVLLMALILSPTDAALGQAVVTNPAIPERIRRAINVESGLNDGMALPPILVCIAALSEAGAGHTGTNYWINFTLKQLILGPVAGVFVGWFGGLLVDKASRAGWMNETYQRLSSASLAVIAYASAEAMHGNGFMAAFFSGLALGTRTPSVRERIHEFAEAEGQQLALFIFLMLGLILVPATHTLLGHPRLGIRYLKSYRHQDDTRCSQSDRLQTGLGHCQFHRMVWSTGNCFHPLSSHSRRTHREIGIRIYALRYRPHGASQRFSPRDFGCATCAYIWQVCFKTWVDEKRGPRCLTVFRRNEK